MGLGCKTRILDVPSLRSKGRCQAGNRLEKCGKVRAVSSVGAGYYSHGADHNCAGERKERRKGCQDRALGQSKT